MKLRQPLHWMLAGILTAAVALSTYINARAAEQIVQKTQAAAAVEMEMAEAVDEVGEVETSAVRDAEDHKASAAQKTSEETTEKSASRKSSGRVMLLTILLGAAIVIAAVFQRKKMKK